MHLSVHEKLYRGSISSRFFLNSEALASEFLKNLEEMFPENLEEMFPWY